MVGWTSNRMCSVRQAVHHKTLELLHSSLPHPLPMYQKRTLLESHHPQITLQSLQSYSPDALSMKTFLVAFLLPYGPIANFLLLIGLVPCTGPDQIQQCHLHRLGRCFPPKEHLPILLHHSFFFSNFLPLKAGPGYPYNISNDFPCFCQNFHDSMEINFCNLGIDGQNLSPSSLS